MDSLPPHDPILPFKDEMPRVQPGDPAAGAPILPETFVETPLEPPIDPSRRRRVWFELAAVVALFYVPVIASGLEGLLDPVERDRWHPTESVWHIVYAVSWAVPTLYLMVASGEPLSRFGLVRPRLSHLVIGGALLAFLPAAIDAMFLFVERFGLTRIASPPPAPRARRARVLYVTGIVASSAAQELVARGYVVPRLLALTRHTTASIVLSAALFASFHAYQGLGGLVSAFVWGLVYAAAFCVSRSIGPLIVGHSIYNLYVHFHR